MLVFITVMLIFLFILLLPWRIKVSLSFSSRLGEGKMKVFIFGLNILEARADLDIYNRAIKIRFKKKVKYIKLNRNAYDRDSVLYMAKNMDTTLLGHIDIKFISLNAEIGLENAFYSTIFTQSLRILYASVLSVLRGRQIIDSSESIMPNYNENNVKLDFSCIINMSLGELLGGIAEMLIKKAKRTLRRSYDY